ncbi:hypothetical protein QYM36_002153 [Artemia franciscana]|uniref:Uncharacterized protein n=1 Tax=Artemia franciscana TaxID=6661 RepID=A0AA88I6M4_ARTSF|nr:hypothetical protein QYM36_002153 [Artemia franciscana]
MFEKVEDISSNDDKNMLGGTHPMLLMKQEAKPFAISTGTSGDCHHDTDSVKLESKIDVDEVPVYPIIKELIQEKKLLNVIYVTKHSAKKAIYLFTKELILEKNHLSVTYVAKHSTKKPPYLFIKELTLKKNPLNVKYAKKYSAEKPTYLFIKELILGKNLSNVMYVRNALLIVLFYLIIKKLTLKKNPLNVKYVTKHFAENLTYLFIKELILGKSLSNVICVRGVLLKDPVYPNIKELILEKNHSNVMYVTKLFAKKPTYMSIKELILEKNLLNVLYVRNVLLRVPFYLVMKGLIRDKNFFNALTCLQPCKDLSSKLYGISLIMENELFHCSHLQGKHHPADLLSRPEILEEFSPLQFTEEEAEFLAAEAEEISSNENKDIFGSTHPMLLIKEEAKLFVSSTSISGDYPHNADHVKLESSIDGDEAIETEAAESVASCLSNEREKEILENRQYVKALLKSTELLGRQGLAFCGHDEGGLVPIKKIS